MCNLVATYKIPWAVVGFAPLIQEAHQCAKDSRVQGGSQSHPSGCTLEVVEGTETHY